MLKIFINPGQFRKFAEIINRPLLILSLSTLTIGLTIIFFFSPDDYQQGSTVKIMYVHVPAAWIALMTFFIMTIYSILALAFKMSCAIVGTPENEVTLYFSISSIALTGSHLYIKTILVPVTSERRKFE